MKSWLFHLFQTNHKGSQTSLFVLFLSVLTGEKVESCWLRTGVDMYQQVERGERARGERRVCGEDIHSFSATGHRGAGAYPRWGTPWTSRQFISWHIETIHTYRHLESPINLPWTGLWEETEVLGVNPHGHRENMQSLGFLRLLRFPPTVQNHVSWE